MECELISKSDLLLQLGNLVPNVIFISEHGGPGWYRDKPMVKGHLDMVWSTHSFLGEGRTVSQRG